MILREVVLFKMMCMVDSAFSFMMLELLKLCKQKWDEYVDDNFIREKLYMVRMVDSR